jgi:hypothetical protein
MRWGRKDYRTNFIECALFRNVLDNDVRKLLLCGIGMSVKNLLSLLIGSNCHYCLISDILGQHKSKVADS